MVKRSDGAEQHPAGTRLSEWKQACDEHCSCSNRSWTLLIVDALMDGPARHTDLQRQTGIPADTLRIRLKEMTLAGLVERRPYSGTHARYQLTELGRQTFPIVEALHEFGERLGR